MVRLDIGGFKSGGRSLSRELEAAELGLDPNDFEALNVEIELDREGDRILVQFETSGTAHLICDRTSEPFAQEVQGTHTLLFVPHDRVESLSDGSDDVVGFDPTDTSLDVTDAVRDTLLLSIPLRKIAPGAEDLEIPTAFGESGEDIDPRWEALRKLQQQSE
ncbi:MAG: DUF177 domain-containing protein [Rhodothermales bacterium]|nr:DUF177 domain-containing protein [Rhodothermales bacterium]